MVQVRDRANTQMLQYVLTTFKFRWELIAGEDRLVAFDIWRSPFSSSPPKAEYMKSLSGPYSVRNKNYKSSILRAGIRTRDLRGGDARILEDVPVFATEYGQPIRHALPQAVWGLAAFDDSDASSYSDDQVGGSKIRIYWEIESPRGSALMEAREG